MRFKQFLIENFFSADPDQVGDMFIPTTGAEFSANTSAPDVAWLQWKWRQEKLQGRKFHNIDLDEFLKIKFVSMKGNCLPDGKWIHKPDSGKPASEPVVSDMVALGYSKNSKELNILPCKPMITAMCPLNQKFGDSPSNKWSSAAN